MPSHINPGQIFPEPGPAVPEIVEVEKEKSFVDEKQGQIGSDEKDGISAMLLDTTMPVTSSQMSQFLDPDIENNRF